ncbi:hypothetical protein PsorP6_010233 [Peronosclerospora sorghi]|uniref:Uncharacterized protein n=1 Tax=Peronosclerospora sorghi TaxID=230839 RepID=A0ACC0VXS5_9STRA|nr:hypothetical protein PsorP6_010233 [Peronosclerospora sorghi]
MTLLVKLSRKPEIQLARMQLPVCSYEQETMEAITDNDVVILCGETVSGKTTRVPQFFMKLVMVILIIQHVEDSLV